MASAEYRLAVHSRAYIAPVVEAIGVHDEEVIDATARQLMGSHESSMRITPESAVFAHPSLAMHLIRLTDEMQWLLQGEVAGRYPEGSSRTALWALHELDEYAESPRVNWELAPNLDNLIAQRLQITQRKWDIASDFSSALVYVHERLSKEALECYQFLYFADDPVWLDRLSDLQALASAISVRPTLSLSPASVKRLAWGLSGAQDVWENRPVVRRHGARTGPRRWLPATGVLTSELFYSPGGAIGERTEDRERALRQVREDIAEAATMLGEQATERDADLGARVRGRAALRQLME